MNKQYKSSLLLFITAIIWGVAFVAQDVGMDYWTPLAFNGIRAIIGAAVLVPFIFLRDKKKGAGAFKWSDKTLIIGGVLCGLALLSATTFQQYGIQMSSESAGKAGFITAFYIVLVPIAGIFIKKRCSTNAFIAAIMGAVGLYILCIPQGEVFTVQFADVLVFICAVIFTIQIMLVDYYSPKVDGVKLACIEFFTTGVVSIIASLFTEDFNIPSEGAAWVALLYAGALSMGVAYTLQIIGQKNLNPTAASLIMSLEACVSVVAAWVILGDKMSSRQIMGCVIMFAAIILSQLQLKKKEN